MKSFTSIISAFSVLASVNALALPKLSARQPNCQIIAPTLINFSEADLESGPNYGSFSPSTNFLVSGSSVPADNLLTLAAFDIPSTVPGPCSVEFYFPTADSFSDLGSSSINAYALPDGSTNLKDLYLFGTTNFETDGVFPKKVEVNSPACPTSGTLYVGFEAASDGTVVSFDEVYGSGLFVFKGDCYGTPNFY